MLKAPSDIESARQARRSVGLIRQRLLRPSPGVLENCTPHLQTAIDSLMRLQHSLQGSESPAGTRRQALQTEVFALRQELSQVNALLRNAAAFYTGLGQLLLPQADESVAYTPAGRVTPSAAPTLRVEA